MTNKQEIILALIAPIGVDLSAVKESMEEAVKNVAYTPIVIKLSEILKKRKWFSEIKSSESGECQRFDKLMKAGDKLRKDTNSADALATLAILEIIKERKRNNSEKIAYIVDSIKNPEELILLRSIYGKIILSFAIIDSKENRIDNLAKRFSLSNNSNDVEKYRAKAEEYINRDYNSDGGKHKQNIRDTFPLADAFVRMDRLRENLNRKIQRIINVWFGHPFITPTKDEYGMFLAKSAALRSSDLSRQVGAAICTPSGEIMAVGCNEVPHPNGELMWGESSNDRRDFVIGYDSSAKMKGYIISEVMKRLDDGGLLNITKRKGGNIDDISRELAFGKKSWLLKDARVSNMLEFGRVVHAEMTAITECSRRGLKTSGATLYCTTFPCHMCARHIVASGLMEVYYIEPYPKSMARELYVDIIDVVDSTKESSKKTVNFISFEGIGPNRYVDMFDLAGRKRKDKAGNALKWDPKKSRPIVDRHNAFYRDIEQTAISPLADFSLASMYGQPITRKKR